MKENRCEHCGRRLASQEEQGRLAVEYRRLRKPWRGGPFNGYCDGVLVLGPDPFQEEIHGDFTEYWECEGELYDSYMEI